MTWSQSQKQVSTASPSVGRSPSVGHSPLTSVVCPVQVRKTQTAGLVATGAAVGYYFISPSLRVEEIHVPSSSLLATAPMFGIGAFQRQQH